MDEDISTEQKTWQVYNLGKRTVFRLDLNESRGGFLSERKGKVIPCRWTENRRRRENQQWRVWCEEYIYVDQRTDDMVAVLRQKCLIRK